MYEHISCIECLIGICALMFLESYGWNSEILKCKYHQSSSIILMLMLFLLLDAASEFVVALVAFCVLSPCLLH